MSTLVYSKQFALGFIISVVVVVVVNEVCKLTTTSLHFNL